MLQPWCESKTLPFLHVSRCDSGSAPASARAAVLIYLKRWNNKQYDHICSRSVKWGSAIDGKGLLLTISSQSVPLRQAATAGRCLTALTVKPCQGSACDIERELRFRRWMRGERCRRRMSFSQLLVSIRAEDVFVRCGLMSQISRDNSCFIIVSTSPHSSSLYFWMN